MIRKTLILARLTGNFDQIGLAETIQNNSKQKIKYTLGANQQGTLQN